MKKTEIPKVYEWIIPGLHLNCQCGLAIRQNIKALFSNILNVMSHTRIKTKSCRYFTYSKKKTVLHGQLLIWKNKDKWANNYYFYLTIL